MSTEPSLELWYRALSSPFGIEIDSSSFEQVRAKLYHLRREAQDPDLEQIAICRSPFNPDRIWLVKKAPGNEET